MKKSIIEKSISRKISTGAYESLDIHVKIQEEVEWETIEERVKKTEAVSKILLIDFVQTLNKVSEELKVNKKIAQKSSTQNSKESKEKTKNDSISSNTEEFDFLG